LSTKFHIKYRNFSSSASPSPSPGAGFGVDYYANADHSMLRSFHEKSSPRTGSGRAAEDTGYPPARREIRGDDWQRRSARSPPQQIH
jgi:hypothetical protein